VQAAEYHLRRELGLVGVDDLELVERGTADGGVEVVFTARGERYAVRVALAHGPSARMLTCTADQPAIPPSYTLEGIERA
jgi:hypothetical protein